MSGDSIKIRLSENIANLVVTKFADSPELPASIQLRFQSNTDVRKRKTKNSSIANVISEGPLDMSIGDIMKLQSFFRKLYENGDESCGAYLHELLSQCEVVLPQPPVTERNPELEARVQRLRKEQEEREYKAMTKNVDNVRAHHPDDTLAYQMKMLNTHLIAVFQFVVSVAAGFTFGFLGIELIVGQLEFGFRLLLGVACALIIALAEIYFLAKKLSEDYQDAPVFVQPPRDSHVLKTQLNTKHHEE